MGASLRGRMADPGRGSKSVSSGEPYSSAYVVGWQSVASVRCTLVARIYEASLRRSDRAAGSCRPEGGYTQVTEAGL